MGYVLKYKFVLVVICIFYLLLGIVFYQYKTFIAESALPVSIYSNLEQIEIADTPEKLERGLMYRKNICQKCGILFIFSDSKPRSFWMKNTIISLDIIFIDTNGKIVAISENTIPQNDKILYSSYYPAQFVLEVNAGFSKSNNINTGDSISIEKIKQKSIPYLFVGENGDQASF